LNKSAHLFCLSSFNKLKLPEDYLQLPNAKRVKVVKVDPSYNSCINSNNELKQDKQNNKKSNRIKATCINKFESEKYCVYGDVYEDIDNYVKMGNNVKTVETIKNIKPSRAEKKSIQRETINDNNNQEENNSNSNQKETNSTNNQHDNSSNIINQRANNMKLIKYAFARSLTEAKIEMLKKSSNNQGFFNGVYVASDSDQNKLTDLTNTVFKIFPDKNDKNEIKSSSDSLSENSINGKSVKTNSENNTRESYIDIVRTISSTAPVFRKTTSDMLLKNNLASEGLVNTVNKSSIKGPITLKRSNTFIDAMKHSKSQSIVLKLSKYEKFERQQSHKQEKQLQHHINQQKKQEQQYQEIQQQQQQLAIENKTPNLAKPVIKIQRASSDKKPLLKENQRKSIIFSYSREGHREDNQTSTKQRTSNNSPEISFNNVNNNVNTGKTLEEIEESTNDFKLDFNRTAFDSNRVKTAKSMKSTCSTKSNRSNVSTPKYVVYSNNNNTSVSIPPRVGYKNASIHFNSEETTISPIKPQQVSLMPAMSRSLTSYGFDVNNCKSVVDESKQIFRVNGHGVSFNKQTYSKIPKISFEIASPSFNISNQNVSKLLK
jgi:hypothetical protein